MLCIVSDGIWVCKCSGQKLHSSTFLQLHNSFKDTTNSTKCPKRVYSNISTIQMVYYYIDDSVDLIICWTFNFIYLFNRVPELRITAYLK